jgi:acyl-CoA oxidase
MENYDLHSRKAKQLLSKASIKDVKEFATLCFTDALVGSLHYEMFLPTILNLGTEE